MEEMHGSSFAEIDGSRWNAIEVTGSFRKLCNSVEVYAKGTEALPVAGHSVDSPQLVIPRGSFSGKWARKFPLMMAVYKTSASTPTAEASSTPPWKLSCTSISAHVTPSTAVEVRGNFHLLPTTAPIPWNLPPISVKKQYNVVDRRAPRPSANGVSSLRGLFS